MCSYTAPTETMLGATLLGADQTRPDACTRRDATRLRLPAEWLRRLRLRSAVTAGRT